MSQQDQPTTEQPPEEQQQITTPPPTALPDFVVYGNVIGAGWNHYLLHTSAGSAELPTSRYYHDLARRAMQAPNSLSPSPLNRYAVAVIGALRA